MAYAQLKTDIAAVIRNNGNQEITGNVLQGALLEMINALGANYQYAGVADTSTTITTTEANVFYLLTEAGTYANMSSSIVHASGIGIAIWNGSAWSYQNVPSAAVVATDATITEGSINPVQSGVVYPLKQFSELAENHIAPYCNFIGDARFNANGTIAKAASTLIFVYEEEYIPVKNGDVVEWCYGDAESNNACISILYNANKEVITYYTGNSATGIRTLNISNANAGYMRFTFIRSALNFAYVKVNGITMYKPLTITSQTNSIIPIRGLLTYSELPFLAQNGSQGNFANPNIITLKGNNASKTGIVIPCTYGHKYKIVINRPNASGCVYCYAYYTYSTLTPSNITKSVIHKDDTHKTPIGQLLEITDANAVAMTITIAERVGNEDGAYNPIRITDFDFQTMGDIRILDVTETITEQIRPLLPTIEELADNGIISRNEDKLPMLVNSCRFRKTNTAPYKDWQGLICTDSHGDTQAVNNAIDASEGIVYIDCLLHLGDYAGGYYDSAMVTSYQSQVARCTKPWYFVIGNHDVGNGYYVGLCCDHSQAYTSFIAPLVSAGFIPPTDGKCYWYKDLTDYKLRIIALYEYDDPMDFDETYWKAITYDSTLANIAPSTTYSVGQKVNAGKFGSYGQAYTAYSFECVQSCTTSTTPYNSASVLPKYKIRRGDRVIRQTQAQWFLDTLSTTPANYGVVVLTHNPYGQTIVAQDVRFNYVAGNLGSSASQDDMNTNFIQDALAAFKAGSNYSANVAMKGDAAYMNTQGGNTYAYSVSKNFANKNTGVYVACVLGGHVHADKVWKDETAIIYQICPICATTNIGNATNQDIRRTDTDGLCYDSLTVVSTAKNRIGLTKLGVNVTENGVKRDYEVIDTSV